MGSEEICVFKAFDILRKTLPGKGYGSRCTHHLPLSWAFIQQTSTLLGEVPNPPLSSQRNNAAMQPGPSQRCAGDAPFCPAPL